MNDEQFDELKNYIVAAGLTAIHYITEDPEELNESIHQDEKSSFRNNIPEKYDVRKIIDRFNEYLDWVRENEHLIG